MLMSSVHVHVCNWRSDLKCKCYYIWTWKKNKERFKRKIMQETFRTVVCSSSFYEVWESDMSPISSCLWQVEFFLRSCHISVQGGNWNIPHLRCFTASGFVYKSVWIHHEFCALYSLSSPIMKVSIVIQRLFNGSPYIKSFIHSFHWHVQNSTIPCRFQELLPFVCVMYFFLPPFPSNCSSILSHTILPSISWSTSQSSCSQMHI